MTDAHVADALSDNRCYCGTPLASPATACSSACARQHRDEMHANSVADPDTLVGRLESRLTDPMLPHNRRCTRVLIVDNAPAGRCGAPAVESITRCGVVTHHCAAHLPE